jgi:hypothetical protein
LGQKLHFMYIVCIQTKNIAVFIGYFKKKFAHFLRL